MPVSGQRADDILNQILSDVDDPDEVIESLRPRLPENDPLPPTISGSLNYDEEAVHERRDRIKENSPWSGFPDAEEGTKDGAFFEGNIENFIGQVRMPVGAAGPLRVNGLHAHGDFYVPLATTEAALVSSYNRGIRVVSTSGGATALCLSESISRAPCFVFKNVREAGSFLAWVVKHQDEFNEVAEQTSDHCELIDVQPAVNGREIHLLMEYLTGDAAGQNMVTVASDAIRDYILENAPVQPQRQYVEGNLSGDKKATMLSFTRVRGKKVVAEAEIPSRIIEKYLRSTPEDLKEYIDTSISAGIQSGSIGVQGHYANALAALFIACGQDVACVSEAATGLTQMNVTDEGDLYASVTLPNLVVGTVGGGTRMPTASSCLEMMGCYGTGKAKKFAEICASTVLAGEISIIAALASGGFAEGHEKLRKRNSNEG